MKQTKRRDNRLVVRLNGKTLAVTRLIISTFRGPSSLEVIQLNCNPQDTRLINLMYASKSKKIRNSYDTRGKYKYSNMSKEQAIRCKELIRKGYAISSIAIEVGVTECAVKYIKWGRTFKWLEC